MGDKKENSYSHILKYTGLFGSVQGLGILVGVLRNKFTALFLGPSGMGLLSLFSSTISVLSSACNFGIPTSGVKFISEKGIPTPNLFNGGANFHGPYEYVTTESMALLAKTLIEIAKQHVLLNDKRDESPLKRKY